MKLKRIKLEIYYIRKSFFEYRKGWEYLYGRFWRAKRILRSNQIFGKPASRDDFSIHLLTCHRDLIMTVWSLASFYKAMPVVGQLYIHNDGSLSADDKNILKKYFPAAILVEPEDINRLIGDRFSKQPVISKIRRERKDLILLKKLIDPLVISEKKFKLVIDPDLVWFKEPLVLSEALREQTAVSLMMANNALCPVYFKDGKISDQLSSFNSGIVFFDRKNFNLDKLSEYFERIDLDDKRNNHFIEQAGFAYCLDHLEKMPAEFFTIKDKVGPEVVIRHYTSPRRPLFYLEALKILINNLDV